MIKYILKYLQKGWFIGIIGFLIGLAFLMRDLFPNYDVSDPSEWPGIKYVPFVTPIIFLFIGIIFILPALFKWWKK